MSESDGIEETLDQSLRDALREAERAGYLASRVIGRVREMTRQRKLDADLRQEAMDRYQQLWEQAREKMAVVDDDQWWEQAAPAQIADVYEVAVSWRDHEVEAARVDERIYEQVLEHYGHDLRSPTPERLQADLEQIQADREDQHAQHDADVEQAPEVEEAVPEADWDSKERRALLEQQMRDEVIDPELVRAHMSVDRMNATSPHDAVERHQSGTRLRGPRGRARQHEQQRETLSVG
ncbi:hypothetical protein ACWFMI_27090 [Nocardiopsis terrae]